MTEFTAKCDDLKTAFSVASLATLKESADIEGHVLLELNFIEPATLSVYATDKDRLALSSLPVTIVVSASGTGITSFMAEPKKILNLIGGSGSDTLRFIYEDETKTLNVYASEDKDSYVSFASMDTAQFLKSAFDDFKIAHEIKTIDADLLVYALDFTQGFLPSENNKKFSNVFITNGVIYGSNGSNRIGAFLFDDLKGIDPLVLRKLMIPNIISMISRTGATSIILKHSSKIIIFMTADGKHGFGFRKSTAEVPKIPISTEVPQANSVNIDRVMLLKKLQRLSLVFSGNQEMGLELSIENDILSIKTVTERKSEDKMIVKRTSGTDKLEFVLDCRLLKPSLEQFQASNVDLYVEQNKCTIRNEAAIEVKDDNKPTIKKPFKAIACISQARKV